MGMHVMFVDYQDPDLAVGFVRIGHRSTGASFRGRGNGFEIEGCGGYATLLAARLPMLLAVPLSLSLAVGRTHKKRCK